MRSAHGICPALLVVAVLAVDAGSARSSQPTTDARTAPSGKGLIVFVRSPKGANGHPSLFAVSPSTGRLQRVTHGSSVAGDRFPAWSPNGRRIAFSRSNWTSETDDLYVVGANGKGLRRLVGASATIHRLVSSNFWPTWSPDGSRIAFVGWPNMNAPGQVDTDSELWVVRSDGRGLKRLTDNIAEDTMPAWSPDGKSIAFFSDRGGHTGIWIISADGHGPHRLLDSFGDVPIAGSSSGGEPAWSPDGTRLAFARARAGGYGVTKPSTVDLYTAKADGSGVRRLTHAPIGVVNHHPSWSPNGRSIVYVKEKGANAQLWIIGAGGRGSHQLTRASAYDQEPDWQRPALSNPNG